MEKFIETVVPKRNNIKDYFMCFISCLLPMLIGTWLVILVLNVGADFPVVGLACVVCAVLYYVSYKIFVLFYVEWEYVLVDDEVRFSKITNKSKRRDVVTVLLSKVEVVSKITNTSQINRIKNVEKKYSFISQCTNDYYFMVATDNSGKRVCIFFEPNDKMKDNFKKSLYGKFFE